MTSHQWHQTAEMPSRIGLSSTRAAVNAASPHSCQPISAARLGRGEKWKPLTPAPRSLLPPDRMNQFNLALELWGKTDLPQRLPRVVPTTSIRRPLSFHWMVSVAGQAEGPRPEQPPATKSIRQLGARRWVSL